MPLSSSLTQWLMQRAEARSRAAGAEGPDEAAPSEGDALGGGASVAVALPDAL